MNPAARKNKPIAPSRSSKPEKNKRASSVRSELTRLIFLGISVYALTCVLFPEGTGTLGEYIRNTLLGLFGAIGAPAIPTVFSLLLFFGRTLKTKGIMRSKIFCSVAAVLSLISAIHLIFDGIPEASNAVDIVGDLWVNAKEGHGGGLIGGLIALGAGKALGRMFAILLLVFITALSLSFAVGTSAFGIWSAIGDLLCIERASDGANTQKESKEKKADGEESSKQGKKAKKERSEKSEKREKREKKKKTPKLAPTPAEEFSALLKRTGEEDTLGSADTDILNYGDHEEPAHQYENADTVYTVYDDENDSDVYVYGEDAHNEDFDDTEYTDEIRNDEYDEPLEYPYESVKESEDFDNLEGSEDSNDLDESKNFEDTDDRGGYRDPIGDSSPRTADPISQETEENEDSDEYDDRDPFEPAPASIKTRRFGKLMGRLSPRPAETDTEEHEAPASDSKTAEETAKTEEQDNTLKWEKGNKYVYPTSELLNPIPEQSAVSEEEAQIISEKILHKLKTMRISASIRRYVVGPAFTRYELIPGEGVRVKDIMGLVKDIALELAAGELRIEAPIPNTPAIGIEVPNKKVSLVSFRSLVESPVFTKSKSKITVCIGKNVTGDVVVMDIDDMPHTLIAGQTKSGKSVAMNCMLLSLLFRVTPDEVKLLLIDPKQVEFSVYSKIPHLVAPVIDDAVKAAAALSWAADEMDRRYNLMKKCHARNRDEYLRITANKPDREVFPQLIIVIDEFADLVLKAKELRSSIESSVARLGGKARACGVHLLIGTQRPSSDIITGIIKANVPARISFKVAGSLESRIIMDDGGAEKLLGKGDLLFHPTGNPIIRAQGAFVDVDEISNVLDFIVENNGEASFDPDFLALLAEKENEVMPVKKGNNGTQSKDINLKDKKSDPLLIDAIELAVANQGISTSYLQRQLGVGYSRGAKLLDAMEELGIIGPSNGSRPREVYMTKEELIRWKEDQELE